MAFSRIRAAVAEYKLRADAREAVCGQCPQNDGGRCRLCGCRISIKARIRGATCPEQRWEKQ